MTNEQLAAMRQALEALESNRVMGRDSQGNYSIEITPAKTLYAIAGLHATIEQAGAAQPPEWWPAVENILTEYGLQAIDFVADFNKAKDLHEELESAHEQLKTLSTQHEVDAAELRRLHEENQRLLAANRDCIDHFNQIKADYERKLK